MNEKYLSFLSIHPNFSCIVWVYACMWVHELEARSVWGVFPMPSLTYLLTQGLFLKLGSQIVYTGCSASPQDPPTSVFPVSAGIPDTITQPLCGCQGPKTRSLMVVQPSICQLIDSYKDKTLQLLMKCL